MFEVFTAMTMVIHVLWEVKQCRQVKRYLRIKGTRVKDEGSRFLCNGSHVAPTRCYIPQDCHLHKQDYYF